VLPKAVTSKLPVEESPEKLPPWPCTAFLALLKTSSAEPVKGILKSHAIIKAKDYYNIYICAMKVIPMSLSLWQ
jgi:hypothetical protein